VSTKIATHFHSYPRSEDIQGKQQHTRVAPHSNPLRWPESTRQYERRVRLRIVARGVEQEQARELATGAL
jgi:hypothetical protein